MEFKGFINADCMDILPQIPKKPIFIDILNRECECKAVVDIHESYCHNCGQKLDWSDEDE